MPFRINHIHIKAADPRKAADWWAEAFGFKILSEETRPFGDRFIRCHADGGMLVSISNARTGETLAPAGSDGARWGLEHFAIECEDIEADIARSWAPTAGGPGESANGALFAFMASRRRAHRAAAAADAQVGPHLAAPIAQPKPQNHIRLPYGVSRPDRRRISWRLRPVLFGVVASAARKGGNFHSVVAF